MKKDLNFANDDSFTWNAKSFKKISSNQPETQTTPQSIKTTQEIIKEAKENGLSFKEFRKAIEEKFNIKPLEQFGENYAEFYRDGKGAIQKLINESKAHKESGAKVEFNAQVAGAFYREELGDIDLVWGKAEGKDTEARGYGLSKIVEKHLNDFTEFQGTTPQEKLINGINEIVEKGKVIKRKGRNDAYNIEYNGFKVGINKGFNKEGNNKWIVTAFDNDREKR